MSHYKHVLVAVDLSDGTLQILQKASKIIEKFGAKLSLIHVIEPIPAYGYPGLTEIERPIIDQAKQEMSKIAKTVHVPQIDQHIVFGSIKMEVLKKAQELNVDLIIVGSHGRYGLQRLLGSTASAIIHAASCDVFVIRTYS